MDVMEAAPLVSDPPAARRRITVDEYYRMADVGILRPTERLELIEGDIVAMAPIGGAHVNAVISLTQLLSEGVGRTARVSVQNPVRLDRYNQPEPDVAVLRPRGGARSDRLPGPKEVLLLIEVAASSLDHDVAVKLPLYARYGIPEYWVIDLGARSVRVCRGLDAGAYASVETIGTDGTLQPSLLAGVRIAVADIFA